ncbi:hypothetical protein BCR42DRAFT_479892 [Absidia repens]|uniref:SET domain-containing protein n=1 Tax=Absidia repens TaxID=90262 RepID=A0A1X2J1Y6_9FUNG|nr:hypothetical protein BCR42DRAFT_479892 [Absidia repens]
MTQAALDGYLSFHGLQLQQTSDITKGRAVISTSHHKRGTVLITSQALGAVVLPSSRPKVCNYCFRKPQTPQGLQRCSQCKDAYFCDVTCFKNAWLGFHQYVCKPMSSDDHQLANNVDDQDALDLEMLERVVLNCWRYNKRKESVDVTVAAFDSLMDHEKKQPHHMLQRYTRLAEQALSRPYLVDSGKTTDELVHYLCRFQCNNFGVYDDHLFTIGEGTYPVASLINHSCRPNAVVIYDGTLLSVVAIEPINPDQEITIAYVDAAHDRPHRQSNLLGKYFFNCHCVRCTATTTTTSASTTDHDMECVYSQIDTLLGNEPDEEHRAQASLETQPLSTTTTTTTTTTSSSSSLRDKILQQVNDWDLLEMSRYYDRRHDGVPDPAQPLTLATYTHYVIQFFAPYLWYTCNPDLSIGKKQATSSLSLSSSSNSTVYSSPSCTPRRLPSPPSHALSYFDDPLPQAARPKVPLTYEGILNNMMTAIQRYPINDDEVVPHRRTTLMASTQLLYDEMDQGHWRNAVKLGMYILIQYCWIYPPYHPILAQHLLLLAKCSWNSILQSELMGNGKALEHAYERGVRRWIMLSKETMTPVFGKKGEQWRELVELEWIFLREHRLKE